jgi:hypothetical protein
MQQNAKNPQSKIQLSTPFLDQTEQLQQDVDEFGDFPDNRR